MGSISPHLTKSSHAARTLAASGESPTGKNRITEMVQLNPWPKERRATVEFLLYCKAFQERHQTHTVPQVPPRSWPPRSIQPEPAVLCVVVPSKFRPHSSPAFDSRGELRPLRGLRLLIEVPLRRCLLRLWKTLLSPAAGQPVTEKPVHRRRAARVLRESFSPYHCGSWQVSLKVMAKLTYSSAQHLSSRTTHNSSPCRSRNLQKMPRCRRCRKLGPMRKLFSVSQATTRRHAQANVCSADASFS